MRRVILHAGQHKTGTSAIQQFCAKNREGLLQAGYLYPVAGSGRTGNHGSLAQILDGLPPKPKHEHAVQDLRAELAQYPDTSVIISAEYLSPHLREQGVHSKVAKFFHDIGYCISVIMYIRPESEIYNSAYVQLVKTFGTNKAVASFCRNMSEGRADLYTKLLRILESPQIDVAFFPYSSEVQRKGVVQHFLQAAGLTGAQRATLGSEERVNESIGPIAVAVACAMLARISALGRELTEKQRIALSKRYAMVMKDEDPEPAFQGIDDALHREIEAGISPMRDEFSRAVWGRSWAEIYPEGRRAPCNAFDPARASAQESERYEGLKEKLWIPAEAILADPRFARTRSWDRPISQRPAV